MTDNGQATWPTLSADDLAARGMDRLEPPRVEFGTLPSHSFPHEWAVWIFTGMRAEELAGKKARKFSEWLSAACLHFAGMDTE